MDLLRDSILSNKPLSLAIGYSPVGKKKKKKKRDVHSFTKKVKLWEMNKQHLCNICHQKIYSLTEAELDHVKAFANGGTIVLWTHRACNRMKGKKSLTRIQKELGVKVKKKKRTSKKTTANKKSEQNIRDSIFGENPLNYKW